ncbi:MAG: creatininase family protein [bacterium]
MIAAHLTTVEIENYLDLTCLIPLGSFEQHGPYLPLITDTAIAEEICKRVEEKIPEKVLLFPAIWFGDSQEHDGFRGTISLNIYNTMHMLEDIFTWIEKSGFKKCVIYNAHGGNINLTKGICEEYSRAHDLKIKHYFPFNEKIEKDIVRIFGVNSESHAGTVETSLLYAIRNDLIKTTQINIEREKNYSGKFSYYKSKDLSDDGILTRENKISINITGGNELSELLVKEAIKIIEKFSL